MKYQFRNANGQLCCASDDIRNLCKACRAAANSLTVIDHGVTTAAAGSLASYVPPNGYAIALAKAKKEQRS